MNSLVNLSGLQIKFSEREQAALDQLPLICHSCSFEANTVGQN